MIKKIKELIWGKEPVLWFPDERSWIITECSAMPSLVGMNIQSPIKNKELIASLGKEYRTVQVLDFTEEGSKLLVKTKYLEFTATLAQ